MPPFAKTVLSALCALSLAATLLASVTSPADAAIFTPSNVGPFTFPTTTSGDVTVTGAGGDVTDVDITLHHLGHSVPDDVDIELVSPSGVAVVLMSDTCAGSAMEDVDLTFDQQAGSTLPGTGPCASGTVRPTNIGAGADVWPVTGPSASLSSLIGTNPQGTWTLHLIDDSTGNAFDDGDLEVGFSLTITTSPFFALVPGTGTSGVSSLYPVSLVVSNRSGTISDVNATVRGLSHASVGDLDMILVAPNGAAAWLASDACGAGVRVNNVDLTFNDEASGPLPTPGTTASCPSGAYRPSVFADADPDTFPGAAPAGPYATTLSTFDGMKANGTWQLYVVDDASGGGGFLDGAFLTITTSDTTAPDTRLVLRPRLTTRRRAHFEFTSSEATSTYECKVDRGSWKPCTSPVAVDGLRIGRHRFKARATDPAGNTDPSPARARWRIVVPS